MSQLEEVLAYLKLGNSITSMEAIQMFGTTRLGAIIFDLKKKGWDINSVLVPVLNRHGKTTRVSSYTLEK